MALSSSSLFHFTKGGLEVLKSILLNGFRVSYCQEVTASAFVDHRHSEFGPYLVRPSSMISDSEPFSNTIMVPMICFCDIPLSNVKYHVEKYGKYAIGVEKNWGIENGLNPVFYIARNSAVAKSLQSKGFKKTEREYSQRIHFNMPYEFDMDLYKCDIENKEIIDQFGTVYTLDSLYLKPLGEMVFKYETSRTELEYYQDEKEWRYIPPIPCLTALRHRHRQSLNIHQNSWSDNFERSYWQHRRKYPNIPFSLEDVTMGDVTEAKTPTLPPYENLPINGETISFIIVDKEEEIPEITKFLLSEFGSNAFTLISKITSYERMEKDIFV